MAHCGGRPRRWSHPPPSHHSLAWLQLLLLLCAGPARGVFVRDVTTRGPLRDVCCINATHCRRDCAHWLHTELPQCKRHLASCGGGGAGGPAESSQSSVPSATSLWRADVGWQAELFDAQAARCCAAFREELSDLPGGADALLAKLAAGGVGSEGMLRGEAIPLPDATATAGAAPQPDGAAQGAAEGGGAPLDAAPPGEPTAGAEAAPAPPAAYDYERANVAYAKEGAKVVAASPEAKKPGALLDQDGDTFMKSDCKVDKWVIVELSQVAKVETLELTQFEPYTSLVREFEVRGRQSHPRQDAPPLLGGAGPDYARGLLEGGGWQALGSFTAEKRKGAQRFELPDPAWARYLALRFLSEYGGERTCAVNGLAVYGKTATQELEDRLTMEAQPAPPPPAAAAAPPAQPGAAAGSGGEAVEEDGAAAAGGGGGGGAQAAPPLGAAAGQVQDAAADAAVDRDPRGAAALAGAGGEPGQQGGSSAGSGAPAGGAAAGEAAAAAAPAGGATAPPAAGDHAAGQGADAAGGAAKPAPAAATGGHAAPAAGVPDASATPTPVPNAGAGGAARANDSTAAGAPPAVPGATGAAAAEQGAAGAAPAAPAAAKPAPTPASAGGAPPGGAPTPAGAPGGAAPPPPAQQGAAAAQPAQPPTQPQSQGGAAAPAPDPLPSGGSGAPASVYDRLIQHVKELKVQQAALAAALEELQAAGGGGDAGAGATAATATAQQLAALQAQTRALWAAVGNGGACGGGAGGAGSLAARIAALERGAAAVQAATRRAGQQGTAALSLVAMFAGLYAANMPLLKQRWNALRLAFLGLAFANGAVALALQCAGAMLPARSAAAA